MDELIAFLRERIAEDEQIAQAAEDNPVHIMMARQNGKSQFARFMDRHGPARVLADVAAQRAILDWLDSVEQFMDRGDMSWHRLAGSVDVDDARRLLALPYADHPTFKEEWRP